MFIQYYRQVEWDPDLQDVGTEESELVTCGQKITTGIPAATPGRFIAGAILQNMVDGELWLNTGTTDAPVWELIGSAGGGSFTPQGVTTFTVGGIPAGTDLGTDPISFQDLHEMELYGFVNPTFLTFLISGQAQQVEVGTLLSTPKSFTWSFTNGGNVADNTLDILDVTGSATLATDLSKTPPAVVGIGSIELDAPGTYSWRGRADNTNLGTFLSSLFTVSWLWRRYSGTSASVTLNEAGIEALVNSALTATLAATDNLAAGNFKYWAWPDDFGSPTAVTGFKDAATNLNIGMASAVDNAFFSNVENGWSYGIVSVTNVNGITTDYRVYRSKFMLGAAIQAIVS